MKILIVEDEPGITKFLSKGLVEEGYKTVSADNGIDGYSLAISGTPDLILLDWMLPGRSGLDVCRRLRLEQINTPIIFLTARDTVQETIEGLRSGANDYIKKPFSFEELLERIKIQLRARSKKAEEITIGNIRIIPDSYKVFSGGEIVNLTQREFELLTYLVRNKGRVCTRSQIIADVWDIHFEYDTGVIDVFINAIRKKLRLGREDDFIRTVRGIGYIAEL